LPPGPSTNSFMRSRSKLKKPASRGTMKRSAPDPDDARHYVDGAARVRSHRCARGAGRSPRRGEHRVGARDKQRGPSILGFLPARFAIPILAAAAIGAACVLPAAAQARNPDPDRRKDRHRLGHRGQLPSRGQLRRHLLLCLRRRRGSHPDRLPGRRHRPSDLVRLRHDHRRKKVQGADVY